MKKKKSSSQYKGVHKVGNKEAWIAQIGVMVKETGRKKNTYIGRFSEEVAAARAYDAKARLLGQLDNLNFPDEVAKKTAKRKRSSPKKKASVKKRSPKKTPSKKSTPKKNKKKRSPKKTPAKKSTPKKNKKKRSLKKTPAKKSTPKKNKKKRSPKKTPVKKSSRKKSPQKRNSRTKKSTPKRTPRPTKRRRDDQDDEPQKKKQRKRTPSKKTKTKPVPKPQVKQPRKKPPKVEEEPNIESDVTADHKDREVEPSSANAFSLEYKDERELAEMLKVCVKLMFAQEISDELAKFAVEYCSDRKMNAVIKCMQDKALFIRSMKFQHERTMSRALEQKNTTFKKKRKQHKSLYRCGRLDLDRAMEDVETKTGWSDARVNAYNAQKKNPEAYFYRFNKFGEDQRKGAWSDEEHIQYMKKLTSHGANHSWGLFSMDFKGRVGYQMSNRYRKLIQWGDVWDMNYDIKGKKPKMTRRFPKGSAEKNYGFIIKNDDSGTVATPWCHPRAPHAVKVRCKSMRVHGA